MAYSMSEIDRQKIRRFRVLLLKTLVLNEEFLSYLSYHEILQDEEKERLENPTMTKMQRVGHFLDYLPRRGPTAYQMFINALCTTNQDHIARMLEGEVAETAASSSTALTTPIRVQRECTPPPAYETLDIQHPMGALGFAPDPPITIVNPSFVPPTAPPMDILPSAHVQCDPPEAMRPKPSAHAQTNFVPRRPAPPPPTAQNPLQTYMVTGRI